MGKEYSKLWKLVCFFIGHRRHDYYYDGAILSTEISVIKGKEYIVCQRCGKVLEEYKDN